MLVQNKKVAPIIEDSTGATDTYVRVFKIVRAWVKVTQTRHYQVRYLIEFVKKSTDDHSHPSRSVPSVVSDRSFHFRNSTGGLQTTRLDIGRP